MLGSGGPDTGRRPYRQIWPICPDIIRCRRRPIYRQNMADVSRYAAGVGLTSGNIGKIWPISADILLKWCRPYRYSAEVGLVWSISANFGRLVPIFCRRRPDNGHIDRYGRSSGRLVPIFCRRRPYRPIWSISAETVCRTSADM